MLDNLEVGAMGWRCESFYPDDLPREWELDYYANYFSALLVPQAEWQKWDDGAWEAFLESSDTLRWCGFGIKTGLDTQRAEMLDEVLHELDNRGQAVGLATHSPLPACLHKWPVTCFDRTAQQHGWRWQHLSGAPMGWLVDVPDDMQAAREVLASFVASLPSKSQGAPFIVRNGCVNIEKLKQFKQLAELLGY